MGLYATTITFEVAQGLAKFPNGGLHQDRPEIIKGDLCTLGTSGVVKGSSASPRFELNAQV